MNLPLIAFVLWDLYTYINTSTTAEGELSNEYLTFASLSFCVFMSVCRSVHVNVILHVN